MEAKETVVECLPWQKVVEVDLDGRKFLP